MPQLTATARTSLMRVVMRGVKKKPVCVRKGNDDCPELELSTLDNGAKCLKPVSPRSGTMVAR